MSNILKACGERLSRPLAKIITALVDHHQGPWRTLSRSWSNMIEALVEYHQDPGLPTQSSAFLPLLIAYYHEFVDDHIWLFSQERNETGKQHTHIDVGEDALNTLASTAFPWVRIVE